MIRHLGTTALVLAAGYSAQAATIAEFTADSLSIFDPEFVFDATAVSPLTTGSGALSLDVETPFTFAPRPDAITTPSGTRFVDVTMEFSSTGTGLVSEFSSGSGDFLIQEVTGISFALIAQNADILLAGDVSVVLLTGLEGSTAASVVGTNVSYDQGLIFDAVIAASGNDPLTGDLSFSLIDVDPVLNLPDGGNFIDAFEANATGLFNVPDSRIPEPASLSVLVLGGVALLRRR